MSLFSSTRVAGRHAISRAGVAGALTLAALGGGAAFAASASAGSADCVGARMCIYTNSNYSGLLASRVGGGGILNLIAEDDNRMDSWENKTAYNGAWYDDRNGGGTCNTMSAGRFNADVGFFSRNGMSSWRSNGAC